MKKVLSLAITIATFGVMTLAFAAPTTVRGYIMDQKCATQKAMRTNKACITACLKGGSPAVLVNARNGKVLTISNFDEATLGNKEGELVAVRGTVKGDSITVTSARVLKARHHKSA